VSEGNREAETSEKDMRSKKKEIKPKRRGKKELITVLEPPRRADGKKN